MSTEDDIRRVNERIEAFGHEMMQGLVAEAWRGVKTGNPVDTGLCAGNWNLSVGAPDFSFSEGRKDPTREEPPPENLRDVRMGGVAYLANATPYVEVLEFGGHSQQAPDGWVRKTAQRLRPLAVEIARKVWGLGG